MHRDLRAAKDFILLAKGGSARAQQPQQSVYHTLPNSRLFRVVALNGVMSLVLVRRSAAIWGSELIHRGEYVAPQVGSVG